jgi:hypothetical protein
MFAIPPFTAPGKKVLMSLTQAELDRFIGSELLWHQPLLFFKYTDGIKFVAEKGNAYWLLTDISAFQHHRSIVEHAKNDHFQLWKLTVRSDETATLTCDDGNGHVLFTHEYHYTTFPLPEIKFYLVDKILMLPSEY